MPRTDQGREPPAFQEYAAAMLAKREYRLMNIAARGLLYSMKLESWVNRSLPAEPGALARILGLDASHVATALPTVMPFFASENGEIRCPELDAYREHLELRRAKLSEGGINGAAITNAKRKKPHKRSTGSAQGNPGNATTPAGTPTTTPSASGRPLSKAKTSTAKSNPLLEKALPPTDPWIAEYNATQPMETTADAYRRLSRGG